MYFYVRVILLRFGILTIQCCDGKKKGRKKAEREIGEIKILKESKPAMLRFDLRILHTMFGIVQKVGYR